MDLGGGRRGRRTPRLAVLVLLLLAAVTALTAAAGATAPLDRADETPARTAERAAEAVRAQVEASRVPAAAWAVVDGDRVVTGARGDGTTPGTPFVIGSLSKSFTALAVVQLVDQTSGLPTSAGLDVLTRPRESLEERVAAAASTTLDSTPGTQFHYCNLNDAILGLLVERVSGQRFGAYVQQEIFDPLEMTHSHTSIRAARADGLAPGSTPWFGLDVRTEPDPAPGALADGYLVSTADDMARYLRFQLGDGTAGGVRVVSAQGLALMHARQAAAPPGVAAAGTDAYGFGWALGTVHGQPLVAHDGDVPGYHSTAALLPRQGRALVVLTGRGSFLADADAGYRAGVGVLAGGPGLPVSRAFQRDGAVVATVGLLVAVLLVASSRRRWRRLRSRTLADRRARRAAAGDLLGAPAVLLVAFGGAGLALQGSPLSPRIAFGSAPDLTAVVLSAAAVLVARAALTLGWTPARSAPARQG